MKLSTFLSRIDIVCPILALYLFQLSNSFLQQVCQCDHHFAAFTNLFLVAEIASCLNSCVIILSHLISKKYSQNDSSYRVMVNTLIINVLGILFCATEINRHNVCTDRYEVVMVSSHVSSLAVTLPLAYWTALFSGRLQPSSHDKYALICLASTLLMHFLNAYVTEPFRLHEVFVGIFSAGSILFTVVSLFNMKKRDFEIGRIFQDEDPKDNCVSAMQWHFVILCTSALVIFVLVYLFAATHIIGPDVALALNILTDTVFRLLFTITALDIHVALFQNIEAELHSEQKSHNRRKAFMKYIFHEMRIPLNSLTMAIDVLRGIVSDSDKNIDELLNTMECSSSFMEHALNSYITVQEIEEKTFRLSEDVINLEEFFDEAIRKLSATLSKKHGVNVVANVLSTFPNQILGDEKQLKYILNNVVMHAARLTKDQIKIEIMGGYRTGGYERNFEISVCVIGNGERIADFEKELFFSPYGMLFTGKIEKDDVEGLSLLISKEIIKLCGGLMTVFSREEGTAYSFQIPFKVTASHKEALSQQESVPDARSVLSGASAMMPVNKAKAMFSEEEKFTKDPQESATSSQTARGYFSGRNRNTNIETPLNSLRLYDGSMYYQPKSSMNSSDSLVFDLNEMAEAPRTPLSSSNITSIEEDLAKKPLPSALHHDPSSASTAPLNTCAESASDADLRDDSGYGHYDHDGEGVEAVEGKEETLYTPEASSPRPARQSEPLQAPGFPLSPSTKMKEGSTSEKKKSCTNRFEEKVRQLEEQGEKFSDLNVLVVDDTPCNLKMLQWLLVLNSVKSTSSINGYEAILAFERADPRFDLIFMDNTMPIMSGLEAVRYMRDRGFNGVIVAVTGNAMPDEIHNFRTEGADLVVTKPMKLNKLKQILACFPPDIHKGAAGADDSELTCVRKKVKGLLLDDI